MARRAVRTAAVACSTALAAAAFGLALGLFHGVNGGLRLGLGNLSTPWLLVAIVPAWWAGSWLRGAVVGLVATLIGLVGFYLGMTFAMYGHLNEAAAALHTVTHVVAANRIWFLAGFISGPVCGAASGALGSGNGVRRLAIIAGALAVAELAVVAAVHDVRLPVVHLYWSVADWRPYLMQAAVGAGLLALAVGQRTRRRRAAGRVS